MTGINRQQPGAVIAGRKAGGEFAATTRSEATFNKHVTPHPAPPPSVAVTQDDLDQAVDFTTRSEEVRKLWNGDAYDNHRAEELSAQLVRDTITWRYPEADSILIAEFDGENRFLAEVRNKDSQIIAYSDFGGVTDSASPGVAGAAAIDLEDTVFHDSLWPHVDALPRTGANAPQEQPPIGAESPDTYIFQLNHSPKE